jgi:hypothetical protein
VKKCQPCHLAPLQLGVQHLVRAVRTEGAERADGRGEVYCLVVVVAHDCGDLHDEEQQATRHHHLGVELGVVVDGDACLAEV